MSEQLRLVQCGSLDPNDSFFDSLRDDYQEFTAWFASKSTEPVYILRSGASLLAFLYLKVESGPVTDVTPALPPATRIKIGTLKVEPHGTRLGERLLKKAFDHAIVEGANEIYVTIFAKHAALIDLLRLYGFEETATKTTPNGTETVLVKRLNHPVGDPVTDYPQILQAGTTQYLLAIQPQWHTHLFPDSMLRTENYSILADVSHTNSIVKTYVCRMDLSCLHERDLLLVYRTSDGAAPAEHRSVATSVCTVLAVRSRNSFSSEDAFVRYALETSVFQEHELRQWWREWSRLFVVQMLYNTALPRRVTRRQLAEQCNLDRSDRWGFLKLSAEQFRAAVALGGIHERIIVD
ncbi:MAG: hypothetical protein IT204_13455 [Fimbriimonadaceae bacterium]|nr:hypothetical protein [Fimbriimonadaceae bacterium]